MTDTTKRPIRRFTPDEDKDIRTRYEKGESTHTIGASLNRKPNVIAQRLVSQGVKLRTRTEAQAARRASTSTPTA